MSTYPASAAASPAPPQNQSSVAMIARQAIVNAKNLVVGYELDGKEQERLIPFVDAYVDSVDLPGKKIVADWQLDY